MRANELIDEANRIGTALWKSSIPKQYKQFPVIGQGATSVVLDKGDGNVLVLTRDAMKKDWLCQDWGLGEGEWIDSFDAYHQKSRALGEMTVFVIQMPKLFPLSLENKRVIKKSIAQYDAIKERNMYDKLRVYLDTHPEGLFARLVEFLQNYDKKQYHVDFLMRNFMQRANGEVVLIDPIVSSEIIDALYTIAGY